MGFVSLKDGADIVRHRLRRTCEAFGLSLGEVAQNLLILDGTAAAMPLVEEVNDHGVKSIQPTVAFTQQSRI
ncbi:hypothetical protein THICB3320135 [Thiomonas sp. CB3]|nr:hypothetical protein THICB3320135 [Thiomonas sp. CB3]